MALSLEALSQSRGASLQLARSGDNWKLSGVAPAVPLASVARYALLAAEAFDGMHLVLIDLQDKGIQMVAGRSQHHQAVAELSFDALALK
ncbi:hypothetical protein, partial [Escherichia coli]|uniref:hypothetical protein n=1 Tax=Escherichia coli TaxID=562 RepID=UPI00200E22A7